MNVHREMKKFIGYSKKKKILFLFFILLGLLLLYYRFFPFGPVFSGKSLVFVFWFLFFIIFKIDGKYSSLIGLFLLLFCGLFLLLGHQGVALRVAIYSYGFLTIGAFLQFGALLKSG